MFTRKNLLLNRGDFIHIAIDSSGRRIAAYDASKNEKYICPLCGGDLILKKGNFNIEHFAHKMNECSDSWHYDMSEWHYSMQARFPEEQREIIVKNENEMHRADILNGKQVIEFQYSSISISEIEERNRFYNTEGYNVAWVFDVQEQYDSGQISIMDRADGTLMYRWSNPKRCLQCFPAPKEYNKSLMIYLYWVDEDGVESFNRVIWSSADEGIPNFKRFIVSEYGIFTDDITTKLDINEFFETKEDLLNNRLLELKCRYNIKRSGVSGYKRNEYICPRRNTFGIKRYGEKGCLNCKYCAAIKNNYKGFNSYCCYPEQVNEITETHPGYESSGIPVF